MAHQPEKVTFAIITCSDTRTLETDTAGQKLEELVSSMGWTCKTRIVVKDDMQTIADAIVDCDTSDVDIILTCGGTGFSPRDVTPEATMMVCQRNAPGIAEAIRYISLQHTKHAMLSRAVCMQRITDNGITLVINFPGSLKAATECFEAVQDVLGHAISMSHAEGH